MSAAVDIKPVPARSKRATDTSAQALDAIGLRAMAGQRRKIFDVVVAAQRSGAVDLSLREIQQRFELREGKRIDVSTVSARVNNLVAAGWLHRRSDIRPCRVTGHGVHPVYVLPQQERLCP